MKLSSKVVLPVLAVLVLGGVGWYAWRALNPGGPGPGFASGNGRIEATEVDVATKLGGRLEALYVNDGDFVTKGQTLARMQIDTLTAQRAEAMAQYQQTLNTVASIEAQVAARISDKVSADAVTVQREAELDAAQRRLTRSETLAKEGASSAQELDDDRARVRSARAAVQASKAQAAAAQSAVVAAQAQVVGARSTVDAAKATVARIDADIADSELRAPRDGRVQYRVAQPGEVLAAGGKVVNLVDLSDVFMTFFLPQGQAGRLAIGAEARIVLDAAPQFVIPATISFVSSTAQFTPKTVETQSEREKLMFRVKAQIDRDLLLRHLKLVKTGLPGVAWVKVDSQAQWPPELAAKVPE
ncbi:HlyD family secretion protein [Achromobacter aloeverae]|uniref:Hemolysin D n=1 Tax=Achromobacter aloeverae TaxID=1750518 RepID=A0A4Q1HET3_9BURK|nr:efflux RND transporter periplasmic adaptor subunit [Achromobacter aloeverae]RXN83833.1 hemolysin D [Achromobacter aloeverae]